jgi:hypothetical protein
VGLAVGAGLREREMAVRQRADLARWSDRLASVHRLAEEARFAQARAILWEADPGAVHLQSQIEKARANLDLAERLDAVRALGGPRLSKTSVWTTPRRAANTRRFSTRPASGISHRDDRRLSNVNRCRVSTVILAIRWRMALGLPNCDEPDRTLENWVLRRPRSGNRRDEPGGSLGRAALGREHK